MKKSQWYKANGKKVCPKSVQKVGPQTTTLHLTA